MVEPQHSLPEEVNELDETLTETKYGVMRKVGKFYEYKTRRTIWGLPLFHYVSRLWDPGMRSYRSARGIVAVGPISFGLVTAGHFSVALLLAAGNICLAGGIAISNMSVALGIAIGNVSAALGIAIGNIAAALGLAVGSLNVSPNS